MKSYHILLLSIVLLVSCRPSAKPTEPNTADSISNDTLRFDVKRDSLVSTDSLVEYRMVMDIPTEAEAKNLKAVNNMLITLVGIKPKHQLNSLQEYMKAGRDSFFLLHRTDMKDFDEPVNYSQDLTAVVGYKAKSYVTYDINGYTYLGGAHGMPFHELRTIDLTQGRLLGWPDFFNEASRKELLPLLRREVLRQYYKSNPAGFASGDFFTFALPAASPALTPEGVRFGWAAYEIDSYAAGMPFCVVPYEKLQSLLEPEVIRLIEME